MLITRKQIKNFGDFYFFFNTFPSGKVFLEKIWILWGKITFEQVDKGG